MQLIRRNLKRIDIYAPDKADSGYVGKKLSPRLLGYINAEVQPEELKIAEKTEGLSVYAAAKLYMRPDAGVKCGDLAAVFGSKPDCRITSVIPTRDYLMARAERI